jgi:hypothetical protein
MKSIVFIRESWQMAMADSGISLEDAYIGKEQFANYRAQIESKIPLAPDLKEAGLGYLPFTQQTWAILKQRVGECLVVRQPDYAMSRDPGKHG